MGLWPDPSGVFLRSSDIAGALPDVTHQSDMSALVLRVTNDLLLWKELANSASTGGTFQRRRRHLGTPLLGAPSLHLKGDQLDQELQVS